MISHSRMRLKFKLLFGKHPKHDMKRSFPQLMTVDVVTNVNVGVRES